MANIICTKLTLEDINACFLRLSRTLNNNQTSLQSQVTNIISSNIETKDKYSDTAIRALIDALTSRVTDDEKDIMNLEGKTQDLSSKIANLSTVIANINCSYNPDTNTLTFTNSTGLATNYELKDTTYSFSFDTETQTLTVHNDLDGEDTSNDFVQQITGTTYTFTWNDGTLTIHDSLADTDTVIDLDARYYTESEIDAFITDINNNHNALANRVTTIEGKIPSAASSSNQLADKEYVNHSITTATATFRGTVETTTALAALTGDLNDYAFLKVYDASTHSYSYDRYKWVASGGDYGHWLYEYSIENTEFTAPQWEALNSGITCALVDKITDVYNCQITLCQNGTCVGSFTLNQCTNGNMNFTDSKVQHCALTLSDDLAVLVKGNTVNNNSCCPVFYSCKCELTFNPSTGCLKNSCGCMQAKDYEFSRTGHASRTIRAYNSKNYTGTRCTSMDIRMFMECFSKCHCLVAGEQLDVKYTWSDANNNYVCWGTNQAINLSGSSVTVLSNSYDSRLWNDACSGWLDFSVRIQPRSGVAHTFTACKASSYATSATICCDNNYDYMAYRACYSYMCGAVGDVDRPITFTDSSDGFKCLFYSCECKLTFNACTGRLCLGPYTVLNCHYNEGLRMNVPLGNALCGLFLYKNSDCTNNCSLGIQIGSGDVNRGFYDCNGGAFRWLTYYNTECEVHCLPQYNAAYKACCFSFPANSTTYVLLGCIKGAQYENEIQLGFDVSGSALVNNGVLKMLLTTAHSSSSGFCNNNIELKLSSFATNSLGIRGVGFVSTGGSWNCYTCVVLKVCNNCANACTWRVSLFGNQVHCLTTCIQCLGSTEPTFTCLIDVPAYCRSFTYSNAIQELKGNICGTLNGCTPTNIVNDAVTCAYGGLEASLNGNDFTSSNGCLTLDNFSFDKVCDACSRTVSEATRRIIENNNYGCIGLGLGCQDVGLLTISRGSNTTDFRFGCGGTIVSQKNGTNQCICLYGYSTDNVYKYTLPYPGGACAACAYYIQICVAESRGSIGNSLHLTFYSMMADLNLENAVNYYCGGYYGNLKFSRCNYACANCNCFWLSYCGWRQPVICSAYKFTVLQCIKGTAPTGVTFSCFCDIVTAGVSGIQSIDFNGSSFSVSGGNATLDMNPDICYDTSTSKMCVILGDQTSTEVDLSSLASDHLVSYCGICSNLERPLVIAPYCVNDTCICKVNYSNGCPLTYNPSSGLLKTCNIYTSFVCGPANTVTGVEFSKIDVGGRASIRLLYDITSWANGTTGIASKGLSGTFTHYRCGGYGVGYTSNIIATANYGRNGASWSCCNTGCIKLLYDYFGGLTDRPVILYDTSTCKYWLGVCMSASNSHIVRFDGIRSGDFDSTSFLCYDANGCLPSGWCVCTWGIRYLAGKCLFLYCGSTCKCYVDWNNCRICLSPNAFNQYAEVDETAYPGVCCTGDVSQSDIADFITMADVNNCGFMKNFCVYCGTTCKCNIANAGCLKLCANAFNANAQISTTTYPGACCIGTIQGVSLNGKEFTNTDDIANLTGFAACDLSPVDNTHTLVNGNQCYVFSGCCLSYCCNGTQYALLLGGCAERAGKMMLKCTNANASYIIPFFCKCALGSECIIEAYRSCNNNEPRFNPSTGQLYTGTFCSAFDICTSNYLVCKNGGCNITSYNTSYVLLGCIEASKSAVENRIGISIEQYNSSTSYTNAQLNLLWIDCSDFSKNSIEIKNVCTSSTIFRIGGIGFVKVPNTKYACVIAQIVGTSTSINGCLHTYGQLTNNWISDVCRISTTPTFDCFVDIPNGKCNFYYNNATMCFEDVDFGSLYNCVCSLCNTTYAVGCNTLLICDYIQPYGNCYDVCFNLKDTVISHVRVCVNWQCEKPVISASILSGNTDCFVPYRVGVRANANNCGCIGIDFASVSSTGSFLCAKVGKSDAYGDPTSPDCVWFCNTSSVTYTNTVAINTGLQNGSYLFSDVSANTITANCISTTSSIKCKCDIDKWKGSALSILNNTDIVQYKYKKENANDLYHVGIIAENTNTLISGKNQDQMRLADSVGLLMKAVQELTPWWKKLWIKLINKWKNRG